MMIRAIFDAVLNTVVLFTMLLFILGLVWLIFLLFIRVSIKVIHAINEEVRLCPRCRAERKVKAV